MADVSIREELEAALAGQGTQADTDTGSSSAEAASPVVDAPSVELQSQPESDGRQRGPDGKFVRTDAAPEKVAPVANDPKNLTAEQPGSTPTAETPEAPKYPRWSAEMKAKFIALPTDVQKYIMDRETEMDRKISTKGNEAERLTRQATEFDDAFAPHKERIAMAGTTPTEMVKRLLSAEEALVNKPYEAIAWLAKNYGVDLGRFAQQQQQPQQQQPNNLPPEIQQLYGTVNQLQQHIVGQERQAQERVMTGIVSEIQSFVQTAPHYEDVKELMVPLVTAIKGANPNISHRDALQQGYDQAVRANPHTHALWLAEQNATQAAKQREDAARLAREAQRKNGSLTGSPAGMPVAGHDDSIRGELERAYQAQRA